MYEYTAKVLRVVDGDTLDLSIDLGFDIWTTQRVRLLGIDTPETHTLNLQEKALGVQAKAMVEGLIKTSLMVKVQTTKGDKYGRMLVTLFVDSVNVNEALIAAGYAWRYDGKAKDKTLGLLGITHSAKTTSF